LHLTDSYGNDEEIHDNDEFIFAGTAVNNGHIYTGQPAPVSGISSFAFSAVGVVLTAVSAPIPGMVQLGLGASSLVLSILNDNLAVSSSIAKNVNIEDRIIELDLIPDRTRHYQIHNRFIRKLSVQADSNSYYGPNNHPDFIDSNANFDFKAKLNTEGTNYGVSKRLSMYSYVQVVDVNFFYNFGEDKHETYKTSKNITQEITYYRYYKPY
jgi:hypothetical protein